MVKVKIIRKENTRILEQELNNFIKANQIDVIDIKFEVTNMYKYAMIIYRDKQIFG